MIESLHLGKSVRFGNGFPFIPYRGACTRTLIDHPQGGIMKILALIIAIIFSSVSVYAQHGHGGHSAPAKKPVWLDEGLGQVDHPVTTKSAEAQKFFNQGLAYLYGFNHAE